MFFALSVVIENKCMSVYIILGYIVKIFRLNLIHIPVIIYYKRSLSNILNDILYLFLEDNWKSSNNVVELSF